MTAFWRFMKKARKKCVMPDFDFRDYEEAKEHLIPVWMRFSAEPPQEMFLWS